MYMYILYHMDLTYDALRIRSLGQFFLGSAGKS